MEKVEKKKKLASSISFIDLKSQQDLIKDKLDEAIKRVLDHGLYIMGPEVLSLEQDLAHYCQVKHAVSCSNGTDALALALRAKDVGKGDAVFVPAFTFAATAEVVAWMGATPIFVDVLPDVFNIDPKSLSEGLRVAKKLGLTARGVITVDMFGQPADYEGIQAVAQENNLWIIADSAQSFGATYQGVKVGGLAEITTTSFFPAKPLGCYGDGGAVFTDNDEIADKIRSLRVHGQGKDKYDNVNIGMNARMDTLQAAILIEKLKIFSEELTKRQRAAEIYTKLLSSIVKTPIVAKACTSAWAQYTVQLPESIDRQLLQRHLKAQGVPTMVYYHKPLHLQKAYKQYPTSTEGGLAVSEAVSKDVLSLPMHPYLSEETQEWVSEKLRKQIEDLRWS